MDPLGIVSTIADDPDLVFRYFAVFSRFEYALKRSGFLTATNGAAQAHWDRYADSLKGRFASVRDPQFQQAIASLQQKPPRKQVVDQSTGDLDWADSIQDRSESDEKFLLRLARVIRNNLFHGGKFPIPTGPVGDDARNREMIKAGIVVLTECLSLSPNVKQAFDELP
jgi:hypothetical protein